MSPAFIKVVIADDHDYVRNALILALTCFDDNWIEIVGEAINLANVFVLCDEYAPNLLLIDITLPEQPIESLIELKSRYPAMTLITLANIGDSRLVDKALEAGVVACIYKEASLDEIQQIVTKAYFDNR